MAIINIHAQTNSIGEVPTLSASVKSLVTPDARKFVAFTLRTSHTSFGGSDEVTVYVDDVKQLSEVYAALKLALVADVLI